MSKRKCSGCGGGLMKNEPDGGPCWSCQQVANAQLASGAALAPARQPVLLSKEDARRLTDEAKGMAIELWRGLKALYDGGAHTALGYASWAAYCKAEFDFSRTRAFELLAAATVAENLHATNGSGLNQSAIADSLPVNEAQARPLSRLKDPEQQREAWKEAVETAPNGKVTAAHVQAAVERRKPRTEPEQLPDGIEADDTDPIVAQQQAAEELLRENQRLQREVEALTATDKDQKIRALSADNARYYAMLGDRDRTLQKERERIERQQKVLRKLVKLVGVEDWWKELVPAVEALVSR